MSWPEHLAEGWVRRNEAFGDLARIYPPSILYAILEREYNDGSPSGFAKTVADSYSPSSNLPYYRLPTTPVEGGLCVVAGVTDVLKGFERFMEGPPGLIDVPIHPDYWSGEQSRVSYDVSPTASGRTVLVFDDSGPTGWVKLHYPGVLGRAQRDLFAFKWMSSVEISSRLLASGAGTQHQVLLEDFGIFVDDLASRGWGIHVRAWPRRESLYIPLFSLFVERHGSRPILRYLFEELVDHSDASSRLLRDLIDCYFDFVEAEALMPECNAQNVLLELRSDGSASWLLRDMGDFFKDNALARELGLPPYLTGYKALDSTSADLYQRRSFSFDFKLGEYALRPLIEAMAAEGLIKFEQGISVCRDASEARLQQLPGYFAASDVWYRYADTVSDRLDYVAESSPRFR